MGGYDMPQNSTRTQISIVRHRAIDMVLVQDQLVQSSVVSCFSSHPSHAQPCTTLCDLDLLNLEEPVSVKPTAANDALGAAAGPWSWRVGSQGVIGLGRWVAIRHR